MVSILVEYDFIPGFVAPDSLTGLLHRGFNVRLYQHQAVYNPLGTNASCPLPFPQRKNSKQAFVCMY